MEYYVCKSEAWVSHCVGCGTHLPISHAPSTLQKVKKSRRFFKCIGQHLVKHKSALTSEREAWLQCHRLHLKRKLGIGSPFKLKICFLCLLKPFKLKQGMSHAFSASKYVKNMFIFILLAFLTPFKPHNSEKKVSICTFHAFYDSNTSSSFSPFLRVVSMSSLL